MTKGRSRLHYAAMVFMAALPRFWRLVSSRRLSHRRRKLLAAARWQTPCR